MSERHVWKLVRRIPDDQDVYRCFFCDKMLALPPGQSHPEPSGDDCPYTHQPIENKCQNTSSHTS